MRRIKFNTTSLLLMALLLSMFAFPAMAQDDFGAVADNVYGQLSSFSKLALGAMFLAGIGVAAGAAFKFKAHSENASQVPLKVPLFWMIVAIILIAIPTFLSVGRATLFQSTSGSPDIEEVEF